MKALVVGGGVAGLAAAVAFRRAGIEHHVFERAPEVREIGAGLSVWRNGIEALGWLGVAGDVVAAGSPIDEIRVLSWRGRVFHRIPVARYEPNVAVKRQDVLAALATAVDPETIRTGARVVSVERHEDGGSLRFEDGSIVDGDMVVGADGIFSTVRGALFPGWEPGYAGHVAWRGIADVSDPRWLEGISFNWYGRAKHFALIPLKEGRTFWYATQNLPADAPDGGRDEIADAFADCVEGVSELIRATDPEWIVRTRLFDLPFRGHWVSGRVALIGDAAHAMRPNLGQGACTALEDAVVLAQSLRGATDVRAALGSFERARMRRVRWIHRWSEVTSRMQLLESAALCRLRDLYLWTQPGPIIARTFFRPIVTFKDARRAA
jgi:2-polyprenyl-6-methoxyphenol hydroxylase-like FAD-dependent oxidoreductase